VHLLPAARGAAATNPEAYAQFLLGRHFVMRGSPEAYQLGEAAFRKAVELDPNYAPAWAMLTKAIFWSADAIGWHLAGPSARCGSRPRGGGQGSGARSRPARRLRGARLLPLDQEPAIGRERALTWPAPSSSAQGTPRRLASQGDLFATLGRLPEAIANLRKAAELDPLSPQTLWRLAYFHLAAGHADEAREIASRAMEIFPEHAHSARTLGFALLLLAVSTRRKRPSSAQASRRFARWGRLWSSTPAGTPRDRARRSTTSSRPGPRT